MSYGEWHGAALRPTPTPPVAPDDTSTVCSRAYRILTRLRERGRGGGETEAEIDKRWREKREEGRMPIYPVGPEATPSLPSLPLSTWADVSGVGTQATQWRRGGKGRRRTLKRQTRGGGAYKQTPHTHTEASGRGLPLQKEEGGGERRQHVDGEPDLAGSHIATRQDSSKSQI